MTVDRSFGLCVCLNLLTKKMNKLVLFPRVVGRNIRDSGYEIARQTQVAQQNG